MNANETKNLENTCANISDSVRSLFPNANLHFLIYESGKKADVVAATLAKLNGHPALNEAFQILKAWASGPNGTGFLGMSEGHENVVFSFKTRPCTVGFIALNTSEFKELYNAILAIHFSMSIFMDTYSLHLKKPVPVNSNIFAQRPTEIASCRLNLKSDIFSVLQLIREGQYDAPLLLARQRAIEVLTPQSTLRPEEFPFPISLDVINYTVENQISSSVTSKSPSPLLAQYQLAEQITNCFEQENLQSWMQFATFSQIMAWGGFTPSQILGAAINTSTNPFIKAIGHMLCELTNSAPVEESHLPVGYNPFLAEEINHIRHERAVEETFEMIMFHVIEADSHLPLLRVANNQNDALIKGKILGWCAHALQAAAKAYIGSKDRGIPPVQAARLEFQSAYLQLSWASLQLLGNHILTLHRNNQAVTMNEILNWTSDKPETKYIHDSLQLSISDPQYTKSLDANISAVVIQTPIPAQIIPPSEGITLPPINLTPPQQTAEAIKPSPVAAENQGLTFEADD